MGRQVADQQGCEILPFSYQGEAVHVWARAEGYVENIWKSQVIDGFPMFAVILVSWDGLCRIKQCSHGLEVIFLFLGSSVRLYSHQHVLGWLRLSVHYCYELNTTRWWWLLRNLDRITGLSHMAVLTWHCETRTCRSGWITVSSCRLLEYFHRNYK